MLDDGRPFAFAGLGERWAPKAGEGEPIDSFTIIVTEANALVAAVHDRMPVILDEGDYDAWLEDGEGVDLRALLRPDPADRMTSYPVSKAVNSPGNDEPALVTAVRVRCPGRA